MVLKAQQHKFFKFLFYFKFFMTSETGPKLG